MFSFRRDILVKHSKSDDSNNSHGNSHHATATTINATVAAAMEGNPQDDDVFVTPAATTTTTTPSLPPAIVTTTIPTIPTTLNSDDDEALLMHMEEVALSSSSRTARATNIPLSIRDTRRSNDGEMMEDPDNNNNDDDDDDDILLKRPLLPSNNTLPQVITTSATTPAARQQPTVMRVRKTTASKRSRRRHHHHHHHKGKHAVASSDDDDDDENHHNNPHHHASALSTNTNNNKKTLRSLLFCCCSYTCMNIMARLLLWSTMISLVAAVFWYSYELVTMGKEPHLIAWFSAGAFVLLGFPISMWGIITHLANYNQPHVQVYIVRILWMVPIYSIESWLAMRFHKQAIYIETLRDFYESYVLYSFLQFLIQVLGGEEALILMLKDKSPTRGYHMWGLQFCVKPWLMGQPVRKIVYERPSHPILLANNHNHSSDTTTAMPSSRQQQQRRREIKRIHWKSPFFVKCKFGVLQYVLLKLLSAIAVLLLEFKGWYNEGVFSWKSGYLYICFLTNISQCWALYCLIFFYYATHNELSPIRPVGKFLSVKALVFFTWWQSVIIALLYQWRMIPDFLVNAEQDWTEEAVAKGIQDYLICVEMFVAAIVHSFVFPHTEYSPQAVEARTRALNQTPMTTKWHTKRLGRNKKYASNYYPWHHSSGGRDDISKSSGMGVEMTSLDDSNSLHTAETWEDMWQSVQPQQISSLSPDLHHHHHNNNHNGLQRMTNDHNVVVVAGGGGGDPLEGGGMSSGEQYFDEENNNLSMLEEGEENESDSDGADRLGSDDEEYDDDDDSYDEETSEAEGEDTHSLTPSTVVATKPGFVRAFIDSAIPRDLGDGAVGMLKGDYHVEKKTLLHHATTSDQYDLFSPNRRRPRLIGKLELLGKMQNKPGVD